MTGNRRDTPDVCVTIHEEIDRRDDRDSDGLTPLEDVVDCEGLDRLVESAPTGRFTFRYEGYEITVDTNGTVTVEGAGDGKR